MKRGFGWFAAFATLVLGLVHPAVAETLRDSLDGLERRIDAGELPNLHSVVIFKDGEVIGERYLTGPDERRGQPLGTVTFERDTLHDIRSVTKSIVGLLFAIALDEGAVKSEDEPVIDYFSDYGGPRSPDLAKIQLRHILTMTSGLKWDERTFPYTDARNSESLMDAAPDRVRYILSQPAATAPGSAWRYSGGDTALAAQVIARATGMPIEDYAQAKLFAPLGIARFDWVKDRDGTAIAASGLRLTPRDMAKIGQLMLDGGVYDGRRILSRNLADAVVGGTVSTQPSAAATQPCTMHYGYFWWVMPACDGRGHPEWFAAMGNGGQRIVVVPSRRIVAVTTTGNYNDPKGDQIADIVTLAVLNAGGGQK
ncbi:MAG: serine hydrolase [Rhodobacteraceae bacterium]|nr:serine hydrolase [Paracoccaceae bacterium]